MRVLLIHPDDSPLDERWAPLRWDLVIDLGWAGRLQYGSWEEHLRCTVRSFLEFAAWREDVRRIHEICEIGNGELVDTEGVDWWALLSPSKTQKLFEFLLLQKIARDIGYAAELYVTRAHRLADDLGALIGTTPVPLGVSQSSGIAGRIARYRSAMRTLSRKQIIMIAGDKWDPDYSVRRFLAPKRKFARPARNYSPDAQLRVLIPSSYRNVTRTAGSYAKLLPESTFLLVTTRADGIVGGLPGNVEPAPLAAYAPRSRDKSTEREIESLSLRWNTLKKKFIDSGSSEGSYLAAMFEDLPHSLRVGVRVRDAWRRVLAEEKIDVVLCGDENNYFTRLPVLLAKPRRLQTVYCSHGALDSNILLRGACSDIYLAKGEMEKDYLLETCGVPDDRIVIGAPPHFHDAQVATDVPGEKLSDIVFFSEPYELYSGRTECLYGEVLPNLCQIARAHGRRVLLKLHPFESPKGRATLLDRVLSIDDRPFVNISAEPMSPALLRRAWFAVTVESSTAVECTLAGVPSFLFGWFDLDFYSYGKQYEKFGAAQILKSPMDILKIPDTLAASPEHRHQNRPGENEDLKKRLHCSITPQMLAAVLRGDKPVDA